MQKTICNIKDTIRQNKFLRCNGWGLLAILAFILCINIEFKWLLIPLLCDNAANATTVNKIILALSYSYIAAAIFHWVVNVLPHKKRKKNIYPFLRSKLWSIYDKLRQCKDLVLPLQVLRNKECSREEFVEKFSNTNLYDCCLINKDISKLTFLINVRAKIIDEVSTILVYREYVDDDMFDFLSEIMNSEFIRDGIHTYPDIKNIESYNYESNQSNVGECIYDLYEKARLIRYKLNT